MSGSSMTRVTRRHFLGGIAGAAAAAILAACGGSSATNTPSAGGATGGTTPTTGAGANPFGSPVAATPTRAAAATTAPAATTTAGSPAAVATTAPASTTTASGSAAAGTTAPAVISSTGKLTYWGGLIFSDDANNLQVQAIKDWGTQNKIAVDVVMINQNETNTKVAAAIESNTMPDAFDLGLDLLQLQSAKLVPLDDLYAKIGQAHGGWLKAVDTALDPKLLGGSRSAIPYGMNGNVLFRRADVLSKAGFSDAPKTWTELSDMSEKVTKPPLYGMGLALSNVGDGNTQVSVLQSWGGRIADDAGKICTIKSDATKQYLQWVTDEFKKGQFPPGATTWDGAGDNVAYQSGQAVFIANTGSVSIFLRTNDKDLLNSTKYSALPKGPKMLVSPSAPWSRAIPKTSKNIDAAKALIEYLASPAYTQKYYPLAIYGPVLQSETSYDLFKSDPVHFGLADLVVNGTAPAFPDVNNTAYADFNNNFLVPKMIQRVVIDKVSVDQAIDEAQKAGDAIYAKYK